MTRMSSHRRPTSAASRAALYEQARQAAAQSRHWEQTAAAHEARNEHAATAAARAQAAQAQDAAVDLARQAYPDSGCLTGLFMDVTLAEGAAKAAHHDSGDDDADGLS